MTPPPRFPPSLLAPVGVAALAAALLPGVPWLPFGLVVAAGLLRWRRSAHPRDEAKPRFWLVFWTLAPCCAASVVPILTQAWGQPVGPVVLSVALLGLAAALVSPPTPAGVARALALAVATVTVVSVVAPGPFAIAAGLAFLVTAVPALLGLPTVGRTLAVAPDGHVRRVHAAADGPRPALARGLASATLVALALAVGGGLHAVLPDGAPGSGAASPGRTGDATDEGRGRAGSLRPDDAVTGGGAAARSGFLSLLRTSQTIELTVRVDAGVRGPRAFYLRGMAYDVFDGRTWSRSSSADAASVVEAGDDGWVDVAPPSPSRPRWRLRIEDVGGRGRVTALWTLPGAERVLFEDRTRETGVRRCADGTLFVARPATWAPGAVYLTDGPAAGTDRGDLFRRRCDADVAPMRSFVAPPPEADALGALAREIVAGATTPADRAARVEAWLRSPRFTYATSGLGVDRARPVADFVLRARTGHCWCFASAMAVLMRSLGHPARLAVGYRPTDYLETVGVFTVRGRDAHAWCEVFYEGAGWVVYDPTPGTA
ncbi:MAG: transglutaminase domain-containing protein, partial [Planctomycetia bacterium]|nr:transglutaminase domain-containing protein [Planctomycetia bacterium]